MKENDITDRIKTFEDACEVLGDDDNLVSEFKSLIKDKHSYDVIAYVKLRIIVKALNEGWKPSFDGKRIHYPVFSTWEKDEYDELNEIEKKDFCMVHKSSYVKDGCISFTTAFLDSSDEYLHIGSKLVFKTSKLAEYCAHQFIDIWADYLFS